MMFRYLRTAARRNDSCLQKEGHGGSSGCVVRKDTIVCTDMNINRIYGLARNESDMYNIAQ